MPNATKPNPDTLLAHVRVLRLTDQLLGVAAELREARDELQALLERPRAFTWSQRRGVRRRVSREEGRQNA
jgi:hypothetical protein